MEEGEREGSKLELSEIGRRWTGLPTVGGNIMDYRSFWG